MLASLHHARHQSFRHHRIDSVLVPRTIHVRQAESNALVASRKGLSSCLLQHAPPPHHQVSRFPFLQPQRFLMFLAIPPSAGCHPAPPLQSDAPIRTVPPHTARADGSRLTTAADCADQQDNEDSQLERDLQLMIAAGAGVDDEDEDLWASENDDGMRNGNKRRNGDKQRTDKGKTRLWCPNVQTCYLTNNVRIKCPCTCLSTTQRISHTTPCR